MTPQPHDFKDAQTALSDCLRNSNSDFVTGSVAETIRFALRLAERVCGEPSEGMLADAFTETGIEGRASTLIFKAMISEAVREIEKS